MKDYKSQKDIKFYWSMVILWMALIFYMSAQPAGISNGMSKGATKVIIQVVDSIYPLDIENSTFQDWVNRFNHNVRKLGHITEYLILGLLVTNAFKRCGKNGSRLILYSLLFCVVYAASDELHQYFVPGRGPGLADVLLDSFGATLGIGIKKLKG